MDGADSICRLTQRNEVHAPVGISASEAADERRAADGGYSVFACKYHAERDLFVDHRFHHALIPLLKNVQRQSHPGQEDNGEGEKRNALGGHYGYRNCSTMRRRACTASGE